jgi:hypothetical protein
MKRITLALQAPYVGLRPFDERDAVLFFGRDQHVQELLTKLEGQQRFMPCLARQAPGSRRSCGPAWCRPSIAERWPPPATTGMSASSSRAMRRSPIWPRRSPNMRVGGGIVRTGAMQWRSLSAALAMIPLALTELYRQKADSFAGQALLLVVDQFEEIFRYRQKNIDEAESFINLLLRSASEDVLIYVVMTMQSDFLGRCVTFFGLPEAINRGNHLTPRLGPDQLKLIIASPLALVGGEIDPVLVSRLVNTLGGEDELPIMEHALLRMWNRARAEDVVSSRRKILRPSARRTRGGSAKQGSPMRSTTTLQRSTALFHHINRSLLDRCSSRWSSSEMARKCVVHRL